MQNMTLLFRQGRNQFCAKRSYTGGNRIKSSSVMQEIEINEVKSPQAV
jgi:hypothetical protein